MGDQLQKALEDKKSEGSQFLTFNLANEEYGIELSFITEIIGIQKITQIPDMPLFVRGVINLRGKVIPVIDVRTKFGIEERSYDERTCIIVVEYVSTLTGLIVDNVSEVTDIPLTSIEPPPKISNSDHHKFINGLGKTKDCVKILLDVQALLNEKEDEVVM